MKEKGRMSDKVETAQLAVRPYRSVASQRPARPARARRDRRIIESLNRGVSVLEIAEREDAVEKPTRDPAGQTTLSVEAPPARPEMAPQGLEKIESGPGNGMGPETLDPQYLVHGRAADRARLRLTSREKDKVAEKGAQRFEIARCRTEIGARGASLVRRDRLRGLGAAERPSSALSGARNKRMGRARGRKIFLAAKP
jgi:hypothetical protein